MFYSGTLTGLGLGFTGALSGLVGGAIGEVFGGPVTGIGNAVAFGDNYTHTDWIKGILWGAVFGAGLGALDAARKGLNPWLGDYPGGGLNGQTANLGNVATDDYKGPPFMWADDGLGGYKAGNPYADQVVVRASGGGGGGKIRNIHLAGKVHPKTGVPFDTDGFPDFTDFLYRNGKNDVFISPTGNNAGDFAAANKMAGYNSTPKGYTWHHHQEFGRIQLVDYIIHRRTGHTGGASLW